MQFLSKPAVIALAACPYCAAPKGTPCTFTMAEKGHRERNRAGSSHGARVKRAREIFDRDKKDLADLIDLL